MKGVFGRYVDVDLSAGTTGDYDIPEPWYRKYLGGRGIGLRILLEELKGHERPLEHDNIMVFATGPLQGTGLAGAGRHAVITKSPKTNTLSDSYAGGFWAQELASSGYDGAIIRGKAARPVYLMLVDGMVDICSADTLWGLDTGETDHILRQRYPGSRVLCIGQAGENLITHACIMSDINRASGRPGFGAVMGSKNLKAIVVKGGERKTFHDATMLGETRKKLAGELMANAGITRFGEMGTSASVVRLSEKGILPTRNFQRGTYEFASEIDGSGELFQQMLSKRDGCTGCPIRCKRIVRGRYRDRAIEERFGGPEYETLAAFGSNCLNSDLASICLANQMCNKYGLDTISTGVSIAFAMEASERGLIRESIQWGDPEAVLKLIEDIAFGKGFGEFLGRGMGYAALKLDADFAMHIKGQEVPMHDPRGKKSVGLSYATTPRGAQHMEAMHDDAAEGLGKHVIPEAGLYGPIDRMSWEKKARFCKLQQDIASFANSAIACHFVGFDVAVPSGYNPYPLLRDAIHASTGLEIGVVEMLLVGERNFNLLKLAAKQQGYSRKDDDLPPRLKEPLPSGSSAHEPITDNDLQRVIDEYYVIRGWDQAGPTTKKLIQLEMDAFVDARGQEA